MQQTAPNPPKPVRCRACKGADLVRIERAEVFRPPTGAMSVTLLAARCPACSSETGLASQMAENIERRQARASAYGPHLLGEDIFAFRRRYGLTQQAAALIFGKGKIAFSRYETERSFPEDSTRKLLQLAMRHPHVLKELADEVEVDIPLWNERCEDARAAAKIHGSHPRPAHTSTRTAPNASPARQANAG